MNCIKLCVAAVLYGTITGSVPAAEQQPNILFIFSDDHAAHAMSCYGSKINSTPNLDRIANDGMQSKRGGSDAWSRGEVGARR